jgi:S1-C subfamily serine protease
MNSQTPKTPGLCGLVIKDKNTPTFRDGNGVFIAPNLILTARHLFEDASSVALVSTPEKANAGLTLQVIAEDEELDLAIVKTADPICAEFCHAADASEIEAPGFLATLLDGQVQIQDAQINRETSAYSLLTTHRATFESKAIVEHGHSGGPIFDKKGNVLSVVSGGIREDVNRARQEGRPQPFLAASPADVIEFVNRALA